jgi:hypothetical protein
MAKNFNFKRAATIQVPEKLFNPLVTGIKEVDSTFSEMGGIVPSQVTFITGQPGAGKTTLTLAIGACIANRVPVAFISLEMSDFQLAYQARKIPGFGIVEVSTDFDPQETLKGLQRMKPGLIIVDSIQKAARRMKETDGRPMPFERAQYSVVEMFTKYAKDNWCPVFLIGHCDKMGNYKGPSDLLHDVDSHMLVNYDKDNDLRTFTFGKNRFGGEMGESLFGIGREFVWIGSPYVVRAMEGGKVTIKEPSVKDALENLRGDWSKTNVRNLVKMGIDKLKEIDTELAGQRDTGKVKVAWKGNSLANCKSGPGIITFGAKADSKLILGNVGYAKEQKHIQPRVQDSSELLLWVVVHEWCHLYKGMQHHKNEFFNLVARKYDELMMKL